ncbi:MAG: hypothetical protein HY362_01800 [Candidatus Aenigmarchaeota archaeon]|nr:hypothetical protein [Candidatus Aenigmarchaeota archaeon]
MEGEQPAEKKDELSRDERREQRRKEWEEQKKKTEEDKIGKMQRKQYLMYAVFAVVLVGLIGGTWAVFSMIPKNQGPAVIDGIECQTMEGTAQHFHPHLDLFIDGVPQILPADVGNKGYCMYWVHTHDQSGIIHVESPTVRDFKLGSFFDIWEKGFNSTHFMNKIIEQNKTVKVWVDSKEFTGDPRGIVLHTKQSITVAYGPPYPTPVLYTNFPPDDKGG